MIYKFNKTRVNVFGHCQMDALGPKALWDRICWTRPFTFDISFWFATCERKKINILVKIIRTRQKTHFEHIIFPLYLHSIKTKSNLNRIRFLVTLSHTLKTFFLNLSMFILLRVHEWNLNGIDYFMSHSYHKWHLWRLFHNSKTDNGQTVFNWTFFFSIVGIVF